MCYQISTNIRIKKPHGRFTSLDTGKETKRVKRMDSVHTFFYVRLDIKKSNSIIELALRMRAQGDKVFLVLQWARAVYNYDLQKYIDMCREVRGNGDHGEGSIGWRVETHTLSAVAISAHCQDCR